jgi:hypothetical protein
VLHGSGCATQWDSWRLPMVLTLYMCLPLHLLMLLLLLLHLQA